MPFSVLRHVSGVFALPLPPVKKQCIAEWGYGTNSKLMLGFRSRFWREGDGAPSTNHSMPPANSGEVYSDLSSQAFWETSRLQPGGSGILTNFLGGNTGRRAHPGQWRQAMDDLGVLYPQAAAQADGNRLLMNWHHQPWARGSYSCPRPGQYTTLMGVAGEPELNGRLFFAGEHCSVDWAGYMNGAAHSALQVTAQIAGEPSLSAVRHAYLVSGWNSPGWGSAHEAPVCSG
jgi:monoamine oxidase